MHQKGPERKHIARDLFTKGAGTSWLMLIYGNSEMKTSGVEMSKALDEKPNAVPLPAVASAGVIVNCRYLPPPEDKDGKIWVRTSVLIQADAEDLLQDVAPS